MTKIVEVNEYRTVRLVPTAYIDEPAIAPLYDTDDERRELEQLEMSSSPRLKPHLRPIGIDERELVYGIAGETFINAAFCHVLPSGNRFNDNSRGAWYCATGDSAQETAIREVSFHKARALADAGGQYIDIAPYRECLAGFMGKFHSVFDDVGAPYLSDDVSTAYPAGQALAASILAERGNGILYPSARNPGGSCLVAFRPALVQNFRTGQLITLRWNGSPEPDVEIS